MKEAIMSTGLFAITDALTAHQTSQDTAIAALKTEADAATAAITALQANPPSGVTPDQLAAALAPVVQSVTNIGTQVTALQALVGTPDAPATPAS
jgi:uncharacterized protein YPO0396